MKAVSKVVAAAILVAGMATPALAEMELSFYSGIQESPHSRVEGNDPGGLGAFSFLSEWEGRSFDMPPYYGLRGTWWTPGNPNLGFGLEFTHNKVYADDATLRDNGLNTLEFTDGLNLVTANVWYRWPGAWANGNLTPYVGGGVGVAIPYVEFATAGGSTFEYQMTGAAVQAVAGIKYNLSDSWAIFGEYKGTYSMNEADLSNGGTLSTDIVTNAINVGVSFSF